MIVDGIVEQTYTDSPYVDSLVYYTKILALGAVVKNEEEAQNNESLNSEIRGDLFLKCTEQSLTWEMMMLYFNRGIVQIPNIILKNSGINDKYIDQYSKYPIRIPEMYRKYIVDHYMTWYLQYYDEQNAYYRKILGKPPLGTPGIKVDEDLRNEALGINFDKSIDSMSEFELNILNKSGIYGQMLNRYRGKEYDYLNYVGNDISIYAARTASNFELLYTPSIDFQTIATKFKDRYTVNREFTMRTVYTEAMNFDSKYYSQFITIFILLQTMIDLISEVQSHIIDKEAFNEKCIRYIFESNGIPYYDDIPFKYQKAMLKSLNTLLKYKSSAKCMVEICSLFGFDSVNIFKYYLLRDRKVNSKTGQYVFNYNIDKKFNITDKITIEDKQQILTPDEIKNNKIKINYPIPNFIEFGNTFHIIIDNKIIINDDGYQLSQDRQYVSLNDPSILTNANSIQIEFIYNKDFTDTSDKNFDQYRIKQSVISIPCNNNDREYTITPPSDLSKNYTIIVSIGSIFLDKEAYSIDMTDKKITILDDSELLDGRNIYLWFIYSSLDDCNIVFDCPITVKTPNTNTYSLKIPQPFDDYILAGKHFFVFNNGTFIDNRRYFAEDNKLFSLTDPEEYIKPNMNVNFNFIYSKSKPIEFTKKETEFTVESNVYQFPITYPYDGADFVKYNCFELWIDGICIPKYKYDLLNTVTLKDTSITSGTNKHTIKYVFYYPTEYDKVYKSAQYVNISQDDSNSFLIPVPKYNFLNQGNQVVVMRNGKIIDAGLYKIKQNVLTLNDDVDLFKINDNVVCYFYSSDNNNYNIDIDQEYANKDPRKENTYTFNYPFFRYLQSGNSFIVLIGSLIMTPDRYTVLNNKITFDDSVVIKDGQDVVILFIYNSIYEDYYKFIVENKQIANIEDQLYVKIPFPTVDYYDGILKDDGTRNMIVYLDDGTIVPKDQYQVIEGYLYFLQPYSEISKHGTTVHFIFNYVNDKFDSTLVDDIYSNFDLKFVKVPLLDSPVNYLKNTSGFIDYDNFVKPDSLWNNKESTPEQVKRDILDKEFSYTLTKYISIDTVVSLSDTASKLSYFFNMLFDDVKLEDHLTLQVPEIQIYEMFKLSDLLCYLIAINFRYYGIDDSITDDPVGLMYIKGFNFRADLPLLFKKLVNMGTTPEKIGVDKFITYNTRLTSITQFLNIFNTDMYVRDRIMKGMFDASNKREYDAFKLCYETLMEIDYNKKFFQIDTGEQISSDSSYTSFLKYRNSTLYNSLKYIDTITSVDERKKYISEQIISIVQRIDNYLNSEDYRYLWNSFPGVGIDFIKNYVKKIIDFFKSYKVDISSINTLYKFDNKYEQYIRPIDNIDFFVKILYNDYSLFFDGIRNNDISFTPKDKADIIDKVYILRYWFKKLGLTDNFAIKEILQLISKYSINELLNKEYKDQINYIVYNILHDEQNTIISDAFIDESNNKIKDYVSPIDKAYIKRYYNKK